MSDNKMSEIIKASTEGIKSFAGMDSVIGNAINTPSGVTVIPVSKITMGIATGGIDYGEKKALPNQNFGGGSGTGISISPVAFLTISPDTSVNLIPINNKKTGQDKIFSILEKTPEIIQKLKGNLS